MAKKLTACCCCIPLWLSAILIGIWSAVEFYAVIFNNLLFESVVKLLVCGFFVGMLVYRKSATVRNAVFLAYTINVVVELALVIGFVFYFYLTEKLATSWCATDEKFG